MSYLLSQILHVLIHANAGQPVGHGPLFIALWKRLADKSGTSRRDYSFPHRSYDDAREIGVRRGWIVYTPDFRACRVTAAGRTAYNAHMRAERARWIAVIARTTKPGEIGHAQVSALATLSSKGVPMPYAQDYKTRRVVHSLRDRGYLRTFAEYDADAQTIRFYAEITADGIGAIRYAVTRTVSRLVGA